MPTTRIPILRFTLAELMGAVAVLAVAFVWPMLLVPVIGVGLSLRLGTKTDRSRVGVALAVVSLALYAPFSWLLLIDHGWDSYHLTWLRLWPILPGFVPGALLFHPHDSLEFTAMGITSLVAILGLTWLGSSGRWRLAAASGLALLISVPTAVVTHAVFWV